MHLLPSPIPFTTPHPPPSNINPLNNFFILIAIFFVCQPTCDNHDDGMTAAIILCNDCGNLCADCDRFLHLPRRMRCHPRQVFKEEEEAIKVDLHEGCGRTKLFWVMALADSKTLKAMVEYRVGEDDFRFVEKGMGDSVLFFNVEADILVVSGHFLVSPGHLWPFLGYSWTFVASLLALEQFSLSHTRTQTHFFLYIHASFIHSSVSFICLFFSLFPTFSTWKLCYVQILLCADCAECGSGISHKCFEHCSLSSVNY